MAKKILSAVFAVAMFTAVAVPAFGVGSAAAAPAPKVDICHATHSEKNPFVNINVSSNAIKAHDAHQHDEDVIGAQGPDCRGGGEE